MILDIALGISLATLVAEWFGFNATATWYVLGVVFALLPDVDLVLTRLSAAMRKAGSGVGKFTHEHRDLLHYPILFAAAAVLLFLFEGPEVGTLFSLTLLAHFLHDSVHIGWGVVWLWPFSHRSFKFFSDEKGGWSWHFVRSWSKKELRTVSGQYGNDNWLKHYYLSPSPTLFFEVCMLIIVCVVAYLVA